MFRLRKPIQLIGRKQEAGGKQQIEKDSSVLSTLES